MSLIPTYTIAQRDALDTSKLPPNTVIINSTRGTFEFWNGIAWIGPNPQFTTAIIGEIGTGGLTVIDRLIMQTGTFATAQGNDVASANDLNLTWGNVFEITGTTQINAIGVSVGNLGQQGMEITLLFSSTPTVKHNTAGGAGTAPILLAGGVDFVPAAGDRLRLVYGEIGGVNAWRETSRTTNVTTQPYIKASGRSTARTAAVASVATFTVGAADASFLVSGNVLVTTSTVHSFSLQVDYTDEGNTARTLTIPMAQLAGTFVAAITNGTGAGPYEGATIHIRCKAATAITVKTTGTFTTVTYNVEGYITQIS